MKKKYLLYTQHILDSLKIIEDCVLDCKIEDLFSDIVRYHAILYNLQTLAESTQKLPVDLKSQYPQIPWRNISGFRNILVHDYLEGFDKNIIWWIITNELDPLKIVIKEIHDTCLGQKE